MNLGTNRAAVNSHRRGFSEVIQPEASGIFCNRARRFASLSEGHPLSGWLAFLGQISESQNAVLQTYLPQILTNKIQSPAVLADNVPPFAASTWPRDQVWRQVLTRIIDYIEPFAPAHARSSIVRLRKLEEAMLEVLADQILRMNFSRQYANFLPYVSAALQVYWTALASTINESDVQPDARGFCPSCGFLPVGSIIRVDGEVPYLRYLHCGLCNTQWHMVRVTCASCLDSSNQIAYHYIVGKNDAVRAETCGKCKSYLKIYHQEKSPKVDPIADDLATLALDLLLDEAGFKRMSPNLLF